MDFTSWKTTLTAAITAVAGFVLFSPELFDAYPVVVQLAKYIGAGGMIAFGIVSRDNKVSDEQAAAGQRKKPKPTQKNDDGTPDPGGN